MNTIHFFKEDTDFTLENSVNIISWLTEIANQDKYTIQEVNYIFCSDDYLLQINKQYLDHDYYTDIITFDHSEQKGSLMADIFISIDRIQDNAKTLRTLPDRELQRVMVHGLLHLMGFTDKSDKEKDAMRQKEDACLSLLK